MKGRLKKSKDHSIVLWITNVLKLTLDNMQFTDVYHIDYLLYEI